MLGLLIKDVEHKELEYLLRRELEELTMDLEDHRIDQMVKHAMHERYAVLFNLFRRFASNQECMKYMPRHTGNNPK